MSFTENDPFVESLNDMLQEEVNSRMKSFSDNQDITSENIFTASQFVAYSRIKGNKINIYKLLALKNSSLSRYIPSSYDPYLTVIEILTIDKYVLQVNSSWLKNNYCKKIGFFKIIIDMNLQVIEDSKDRIFLDLIGVKEENRVRL